MKKTISTRLPVWLDSELRAFFEDHGQGPSEGYRLVVEEWWAMRKFQEIEFRDGPSGRRAALRGGPEVWEIVSVWREYDNGDEFRDHFAWLPGEALDEALNYYRSLPEEIDELIAENDRFERFVSGHAIR